MPTFITRLKLSTSTSASLLAVSFGMGLIVWRAKKIAVDLLDLCSSTLLCLSTVLHNDQAYGVRIGSAKTSNGKVSQKSQLTQSEVYLRPNRGKTPSSSTPVVLSLIANPTLEAKEFLRASVTTQTILKQDDSQHTNESDSGLRRRHGQHRPRYPPELRAFYRKTREQMIFLKSAKKLKQKASSDSTRSRVALAPTSTQPKNERQDTHLRGRIPSYDKAKACAEAFADEEQASNLSAGTETSSTISDVSPPTVASDIPQTNTESSITCYTQNIKELQECRKALNAHRRERSQSRATCHKADSTLQCITRNDMCATKFWRKYQKASRLGFEKAVRDLRKARDLEAKLVETIEVHEEVLGICGEKGKLVNWREPVGRDRWIE